MITLALALLCAALLSALWRVTVMSLAITLAAMLPAVLGVSCMLVIFLYILGR